ncbi:MAG: hypothetical protein ACKO4Q_13975 [Planctomycetota bacterium]
MQPRFPRRLSPVALSMCALAASALGTLSAAPLALLPAPPQSSCAGGGLPPCIPVGECALYTFCRPPLPPGQRWAGTNGDPVGFEDDFFSDDFLGACGGNGVSATILVCNHQGRLVVYPGVIDLGGVGEQGDPEIFVRWTSVYTSTITTTNTSTSSYGVQTGNGGWSSSNSSGVGSTRTALRYEWHDSSVVGVRPC